MQSAFSGWTISLMVLRGFRRIAFFANLIDVRVLAHFQSRQPPLIFVIPLTPMKPIPPDPNRPRNRACLLILCLLPLCGPVTAADPPPRMHRPQFMEKMKNWQERMSDNFRDQWKEVRQSANARLPLATASVDLREQNDGYTVIHVYLPDRKMSDAEVTIDGQTLKIHAEEKTSKTVDGAEIEQESAYSQVLTLPGPVVADQLKIERKEGLLVAILNEGLGTSSYNAAGNTHLKTATTHPGSPPPLVGGSGGGGLVCRDFSQPCRSATGRWHQLRRKPGGGLRAIAGYLPPTGLDGGARSQGGGNCDPGTADPSPPAPEAGGWDGTCRGSRSGHRWLVGHLRCRRIHPDPPFGRSETGRRKPPEAGGDQPRHPAAPSVAREPARAAIPDQLGAA